MEWMFLFLFRFWFDSKNTHNLLVWEIEWQQTVAWRKILAKNKNWKNKLIIKLKSRRSKEKPKSVVNNVNGSFLK